ncbi:MAG TPA: VIT1/CCC1 transporter family protein [Anaerolineae bacterium]|nr:VIT1/CCC1 transporter family protein [Anaerolineae bacterium]
MSVEPRIETLPTKLGQAVRNIEFHPKTSLSDIILGGQDGLVNVLGVVLGVAAASSDPRIVIAAGLAATFAESISMGAVAYTTTLADRDFYLSEIEREKREIRHMPDLEQQEIEAIFANWGFEGELLKQAVEQVMKDERAWVDVMMNNELKLSPVESSSALRSALIVGFAAIIGSFIPLAPFLFMPIGIGIPVAIVLAAVTLFAIGAYKARTTVGQPGRSGLQMAVIGTVSALAGYLVGALFSAPPAP